jgi:hypothetical protein
MAKARKEKTEAADSAPKAAVKKPAESAGKTEPKSGKQTKSAGSPSAPLIDTSLIAQAAAKMVAKRDALTEARSPVGEKRESGSFKQLKENLLKPPVQGPGGVLQPAAAQKRFNSSVGARNQVGHNQTFGADVARTGVPRRTSG